MARPKLSVVVIIYRMARQAARTLRCLAPDYQRHVAANDYEVIVVENESDDVLGERAVTACGANFRYVFRKDTRPSPAFALTIGLSQARALQVGVLLDGAHLLTPRVLEFAMVGHALADEAVVAVPSYHLGEAPQHVSSAEGYDEISEMALVESIGWPEDPYRLFDVSVPASGARSGFLVPFAEAGALFCRRMPLVELRAQYQQFVEPGGGALATYLLGTLCRRPGAELFVLGGEGAFHQYHGGVYTSARADREHLLFKRSRRLYQVAGDLWQHAEREPRLLGVITGHAQGHIRASGRALTLRARMKADAGVPLWPSTDTLLPERDEP